MQRSTSQVPATGTDEFGGQQTDEGPYTLGGARYAYIPCRRYLRNCGVTMAEESPLVRLLDSAATAVLAPLRGQHQGNPQTPRGITSPGLAGLLESERCKLGILTL